jgi:hypothetical protein
MEVLASKLFNVFALLHVCTYAHTVDAHKNSKLCLMRSLIRQLLSPTLVWLQYIFFTYTSLNKYYHPIPWRDSISRPIAPKSTDDTTRPRRQGQWLQLIMNIDGYILSNMHHIIIYLPGSK